MAVFAYTAMGKDGRTSSGTLMCDSRAAALQQISRQGLMPVKIEEAKDAAAAAKKAQAAAKAAGGKQGKVPARVVESFVSSYHLSLNPTTQASTVRTITVEEIHERLAKLPAIPQTHAHT